MAASTVSILKRRLECGSEPPGGAWGCEGARFQEDPGLFLLGEDRSTGAAAGLIREAAGGV